MLRSGWQATPRREVLGSEEKGRTEPLCIPEASLRLAAQEGTGMPRRGEMSRICARAEFKAGRAKGRGRPLWSLRAASLPGAAGRRAAHSPHWLMFMRNRGSWEPSALMQ